MRLVAYIQADLDSSEAVDPLLPEVAWSWLVDALGRTHGQRHRARRHRHGDDVGALRRHLRPAACPPARTARIVDGDHAGTRPARQAFCEVLEHAAGLPPTGVTDLGSRTRA